MAIDTIRLSEKGKQQLLTLKKRTGIQNWNVLCRWAFCTSLAEPTAPPHEDIVIPPKNAVEMSWKVFGGQYADVYWALLCERSKNDQIMDLNTLFKLHLHRGVSYLVAKQSDHLLPQDLS